jgi:hypothetical protein
MPKSLHKNTWWLLGISTPNICVEKCLVATKHVCAQYPFTKTLGNHHVFLLSYFATKNVSSFSSPKSIARNTWQPKHWVFGYILLLICLNFQHDMIIVRFFLVLNHNIYYIDALISE